MLTPVVLIAALLAGPVPAANTCSAIQQANGTCTYAENTGTTVEVGATRPGGGSGGSDSGRGGSGVEQKPEESGPPAINDCRRGGLNCYTIEVIRQPTLTDVASFAPASLPLVDEPGGVGLVGMPVNFVVDAQTHTATGELFDLPVTVRFVPASFIFRHGDGTTRETASGGQSWAALGQAQFSATATSHAYAARGTYSASAVVRYEADVDFGNGWVAVPGLLEIPTSAMDIQILEVRTALVNKTCLENPTGVGC